MNTQETGYTEFAYAVTIDSRLLFGAESPPYYTLTSAAYKDLATALSDGFTDLRAVWFPAWASNLNSRCVDASLKEVGLNRTDGRPVDKKVLYRYEDYLVEVRTSILSGMYSPPHTLPATYTGRAMFDITYAWTVRVPNQYVLKPTVVDVEPATVEFDAESIPDPY